MADIKRICSLCKEDSTPKRPWGGIAPVNNRRGHCLGLFCQDCHTAVGQAVLLSPYAYRDLSEDKINARIFADARAIISGKLEVRDVLSDDKTQIIGRMGVLVPATA